MHLAQNQGIDIRRSDITSNKVSRMLKNANKDIAKPTKDIDTSKLSECSYVIQKMFSVSDSKKRARRILYTLVSKEGENLRYVICVIFGSEIEFYLQNKHDWKLLAKFKRFQGDMYNSDLLNSAALLSSRSGVDDCHICLKVFALSKESGMQFVKDYSYFCYFNLQPESCGDIDFSLSEDEVYGDR